MRSSRRGFRKTEWRRFEAVAAGTVRHRRILGPRRTLVAGAAARLMLQSDMAMTEPPGQEIRKLDFGSAGSPVAARFRRVLWESRTAARKEGILMRVRPDPRKRRARRRP